MFVDIGGRSRSRSRSPIGGGGGGGAQVSPARRRERERERERERDGVGRWALREEVLRRSVEPAPQGDPLRRLSPTRPAKPLPPPPPVTPHIDCPVQIDQLSARCTYLETSVAALEGRVKEMSAVDDNAILHLKIMAIEKKFARQRLSQGKMGVLLLQRRHEYTLLGRCYWRWHEAARRAGGCTGLAGRTKNALRRRCYERLQRFTAMRKRLRRDRRVLRALHIHNRQSFLGSFYHRLAAYRTLKQNRRQSAREAAQLLVPTTKKHLMRRAYTKLLLAQQRARQQIHRRPLIHALTQHNGRLFLQKHYNKWAAFRIAKKKQRARLNIAGAFRKTTQNGLRMQYYSVWRAFEGRGRKLRQREALMQQLMHFNKRSFLATYYRKLQRFHALGVDARRMDNLLQGAHGKWRSEHALPRLTTLESNVTGLSTQLPQHVKRLTSLEAKLNALLNDSDQGLEAHFGDVRSRVDALGERVSVLMQDRGDQSSFEAQLAGLRTQFDKLSELLSEMDKVPDEITMLKGNLNQMRADMDGNRQDHVAPQSPFESPIRMSHHEQVLSRAAGSLSPVGSIVRASVAELSVDLIHSLQDRIKGLLGYLEERCDVMSNLFIEQMKQYVDLVVPQMISAHHTPPIPVPVPVPVPTPAALAYGIRDATERIRDILPTSLTAGVNIRSDTLDVRGYGESPSLRERLANISPVRRPSAPVSPAAHAQAAMASIAQSEAAIRRISPPAVRSGIMSNSVQAAVAAAQAVAHGVGGGGVAGLSPRTYVPPIGVAPAPFVSSPTPTSPFSSADTIQSLRQRQRMRAAAFDSVLSRTGFDIK